ncbi:MAG: hypothetical protein FP811_05140 [Desulfobacteraceae bacterium]|nr:hypothetical protein [Desulfobacteraceae bacterium]MBU4126756.1 hypothetical protein [Pseudomonadota bacterium]
MGLVTFDDLYELFYVVSYGFNNRCRKAIQEVYYAYDQDSPFMFYEFFLSQPIPKSPYPEQVWGENWDKNIYAIAPFASRMAEHSTLVPHIPDNNEPVEIDYRTADILQKLKLFFPWKTLALTRDAWNHWSGIKETFKHPKPMAVDWDKVDDGTTGISYFLGLVRKWSLAWQKKEYNPKNKRAKALFELYKPLLKTGKEQVVPGVFVPMASDNLFYGGIWIMLPGLKKDHIDRFSKAVGLSVAKLINRSYLPALAILHEHWLETLVVNSHSSQENDDEIKVDVNELFPIQELDHANYRNPFSGLPEYNGPKNNSIEVVHEIECLFNRLWESRNNIPTKLSELKVGLIFRKYLVCSEVMTQLLLNIIKSSKTLSKSTDNLPACLVIGGPGSGKEKLARMLRLFSEDYRGGQEYVINMASIRPGPLTSALMAGLDVSWSRTLESGKQASSAYEFCGLLRRIRDKSNPKGKNHPTVIFDEFNSMDPDSQGVLLRFLDNSEIVPIGAIEDETSTEMTNCLVVGIMNEDPDDISRERAMEFFRSGEYLGSFLGDLLYEHFLRIRRLRPDIKYRMIRNGKFAIPDLRERGEDIPMLFHVFVRNELERILPDGSPRPRIHFPLDMLDRLTASDLLWPGNVRQLQALAKVVADYLSAQPAILPNNYYIVKLPILEKALQQVGLVKNQMFERTTLTPTIRK